MSNDSFFFASDSALELRQTLDRVRAELLAKRAPLSHWTGRLSASALSTATALSALSVACLRIDDESKRVDFLDRIACGCDWLDRQQNADGGFGDTDLSHSNIATSYLVLAAWALSSTAWEMSGAACALSGAACALSGAACNQLASKERARRVERLQEYLSAQGGIAALRQRYGTDKTFVVPILNNMAIAGLVPWSEVSALPFEAAVFPQSMYRFLGMPVVSYAVPALVAIGQAKFLRSGCRLPWSWVRRAAIVPSLNVLRRMQPDSGGYLEATPLTAFVVMSLLDTVPEGMTFSLRNTGEARAAVIAAGLEFLEQSMDEEGSWPIDTNLATWVTSLSVTALASDRSDMRQWSSDALIDWLLSCQHRVRHPFTGADPGGWGWTDLSGAVPDADDTPGAMLALSKLRGTTDSRRRERIDAAIVDGKKWLLGLQNRDGGWPTFCRGWGKLPFDRSSTDLTAHAIRALSAMPLCPQSEAAIGVGLRFLRKSQRDDGAWLPLWFGNQDRQDEDNPIYGTAKVLLDVPEALGPDSIARGIAYLVNSRNQDGGWGGGASVPLFWAGRRNEQENAVEKIATDNTITSTVEETALAVEALASLWERLNSSELGAVSFLDESRRGSATPCLTDLTRDAILGGTQWLVRAVSSGHHRVAWPIGFYFAKLWYHERLYPLIFTAAALGRVGGLERSPTFDLDDTP